MQSHRYSRTCTPPYVVFTQATHGIQQFYCILTGNHCSRNVLIELGRSFCGSFYCSSLWTHYNKASFSKIRVAYNDLYRKILHASRRSSASAMFVNNYIPTFECLIRRDIFSFTSRLKVSTNKLINTIENCWLLKLVIWKPLHVDRLFL